MFRAGDLTILLNGALSGSTGAFELPLMITLPNEALRFGIPR